MLSEALQSTDKIDAHNNGSFLSIIQLFVQFDSVVEEQVAKAQQSDNFKDNAFRPIISQQILKMTLSNHAVILIC